MLAAALAKCQTRSEANHALALTLDKAIGAPLVLVVNITRDLPAVPHLELPWHSLDDRVPSMHGRGLLLCSEPFAPPLPKLLQFVSNAANNFPGACDSAAAASRNFPHDAGKKQTQLLALLSAAASDTAADAAHGPFVAAPSREDWTRVASSITSSGEDDRWARLLGEEQDSVASRRDALEGLWKCARRPCSWLVVHFRAPPIDGVERVAAPRCNSIGIRRAQCPKNERNVLRVLNKMTAALQAAARSWLSLLQRLNAIRACGAALQRRPWTAYGQPRS